MAFAKLARRARLNFKRATAAPLEKAAAKPKVPKAPSEEAVARMCLTKAPFASDVEALLVAATMRHRKGDSCRPYRCPNCKRWHLTSRPPRGRARTLQVDLEVS